MNEFQTRLKKCPLIAILRGISPEDSIDCTRVLIEEGFGIIEIPLNSPRAYESIKLVCDYFGRTAIIGAGTVLAKNEVFILSDIGCRLIVSPNFNSKVTKLSLEKGMFVIPGVATPTEAFSALKLNIDGLKLFPAEIILPNILKAWRAVLPDNTLLFPVGGITPEKIRDYKVAGASGFGLGTALFTPEIKVEQLRKNARKFIKAIGVVH